MFALEAFGKGAKEVYDFIRLNDATMQRAAQLIKDFNIELQDPSAIRQYRIEMAALQLVWEKIEEEITSALLPALTALAQYLNSGGLNAVGLFTAELRGLAAMAVMLGTSWLRLKSVSEEAWDGIVEIMRSAAAKGRAIMTGAWGELEALSREHETRMTGIAAAGEEERVQIMLRETAAMRQIFGLREEGAVTLPDVTVKSGTKSYTVKDKGGGRARAAKAPKEEKDDSEQRELARLSTEEKVDDAILDRRTKLIEATKAAGKISLDQETQLLVAQLDRKWALEQDYFAKKIAAAQGDDKEQQKLQDQELIAYQNYLTKRQDLDTKYFEAKKAAEQKAAADSKAALDKALAPIEKGFDQAIQGFLQGTQSLKQALQKGLQAIILEPLIENVKNGLKTALTSAFSGSNIQGSVIGKFFSGTLFGGGSSAAGATGQGALGTAADTAAGQVTAFGAAIQTVTAQLTGHAAATQVDTAATQGSTVATGTSSTAVGVNTVATATNSVATEANSAAQATGGIGNLLGSIPVVGSLFKLATSLTSLFGFAQGGVVPSARGGWVVPSFQGGGILSMLHQNEMVLPAGLSNFVQNAAAQAGGGGNGPVVVNISAIDAQSFAKFARGNSSAFVAAVNHGMRNGSPLRTS